MKDGESGDSGNKRGEPYNNCPSLMPQKKVSRLQYREGKLGRLWWFFELKRCSLEFRDTKLARVGKECQGRQRTGRSAVPPGYSTEWNV